MPTLRLVQTTLLALFVVLASSFAQRAAAQQNLDAQQVELLRQMDAATAAEALQVAQQISTLRDTIAQLEQELTAARGQTPDLQQLALSQQAELTKLFESAASVAPALEPVAELVTSAAQIATLLQQATAQAEAGPFNATDHADLTAEQIRAANRAHAQLQQLDALLARLRETFNEVERLRDPAQYAQSFLTGKFQQWVQQAMAVEGEQGDFKFRILPPPAGVSVFSENANLGVEVEYLPGDLTVQAQGLYFEHRAGQAPRAVLEKLQVDPAQNLQGMVLKNLKQLGNELLAGAGLPITVEITGLPDFASGGAERGALEFKVAVGLFDAQGGGKVEAKASDLTLYPGGRVDWGDAELEVDYPANPPIPIGPGPFAFWAFKGGLAPKTGKITAGTKISSLVTPPTVVALDVTVSTAPPIERIDLNGKLVVANVQELGTLDAAIDFSRGEVKGTFTQGAGPVEGLQFGSGTFELRSEQLALNTWVGMLGVRIAEAETVFNFDDGSAILTAQDGLELFGADFSNTLTARIEPGFKRFEAEAVRSVAVPGIQPYGTVHVSVTVRIRSDAAEPVEVVVNSFLPGVDFRIGLPDLTQCNLSNLRQWIQDSGVNSYHQFLQNLANTEQEGRKWAARLDEKTRRYVSDRLGGAWKTGNPALDDFGGKLAEEYKDVVGGAVGGVQQAGGVVKDISKAVQDDLSDRGDKLSKGDILGALGS